ncbi:hypothetical protein [Bradyrhizobium sp.]
MDLRQSRSQSSARDAGAAQNTITHAETLTVMDTRVAWGEDALSHFAGV